MSGSEHAAYAELSGAGHYLQGRRKEALDLIVGWLRGTVPSVT